MPFFIDVFHGFYRTPIVPTFIDIVPFLINFVPTNNLFLTTILHVAAGITTVEAVKLILAEPRFTSANALAPIDEFKKAGRISALGVAAAKGKCEIFKEMVLHPSIDLDVKNEVGLNVDDWLK